VDLSESESEPLVSIALVGLVLGSPISPNPSPRPTFFNAVVTCYARALMVSLL